jgi:hypothetical protein
MAGAPVMLATAAGKPRKPRDRSAARSGSAEVSEDEPLDQARAALIRFVARGAEAGEFTVDDPELTASFLLDGLHGLLLRSLHAGRSRRDFTGAAWSLCARLLAITT